MPYNHMIIVLILNLPLTTASARSAQFHVNILADIDKVDNILVDIDIIGSYNVNVSKNISIIIRLTRGMG